MGFSDRLWVAIHVLHALYLVTAAFSIIMTLTDVVRRRDQLAGRLLPNPLQFPTVPSTAIAFSPKRSLSSTMVSSQSTANYNRNIRQRLHRGMSSIRTFFKSRIGDSDNYTNNTATTDALLVSCNDVQPGFRSTPSLCKNPLMLQLANVDIEKRMAKNESLVHQSPEHELTRQNTPVSNCSVNSLRRKLSQKFLNTFSPSSPTVIVKPELRSRPSVQTMCNQRSSATSATLSLQSSGSSSTKRINDSTPPTSEGTLTGSPGSVRHHELDITATDDHLLVLFEQNNLPRKLSTIHKIDGQQIATIKTVEATAAAKYVDSLYKS